MNRKSFDKIASVIGLLLAGFLIVIGGILQYGGNFATDQVAAQLEPQAITIPAENGDPKVTDDVKKFFADNGEKVMTTGKQAQMYADHYIGFHMSAMPTYAAASGANRAAAALGLLRLGGMQRSELFQLFTPEALALLGSIGDLDAKADVVKLQCGHAASVTKHARLRCIGSGRRCARSLLLRRFASAWPAHTSCSSKRR